MKLLKNLKKITNYLKIINMNITQVTPGVIPIPPN